MKVLFLDVNGVLSLMYTGKLDPQALRNLRDVVEKTGCHLVLSSSWRGSDRHIARLEAAFREHGLPPLIGMTGHTGDRAEEILAWVDIWNEAVEKRDLGWLREQSGKVVQDGRYLVEGPTYHEAFLGAVEPSPCRIASWVSVDDEPRLRRTIAANFVMTDTKFGLTRADAGRAIAILAREDSAASASGLSDSPVVDVASATALPVPALVQWRAVLMQKLHFFTKAPAFKEDQ